MHATCLCAHLSVCMPVYMCLHVFAGEWLHMGVVLWYVLIGWSLSLLRSWAQLDSNRNKQGHIIWPHLVFGNICILTFTFHYLEYQLLCFSHFLPLKSLKPTPNVWNVFFRDLLEKNQRVQHAAASPGSTVHLRGSRLLSMLISHPSSCQKSDELIKC